MKNPVFRKATFLSLITVIWHKYRTRHQDWIKAVGWQISTIDVKTSAIMVIYKKTAIHVLLLSVVDILFGLILYGACLTLLMLHGLGHTYI